jgi:NADP-dependent 3-hydroxy acid dehydrogenase YdfG
MGVVNGLQTFLPAMLEHGEEADIINTSSIAQAFGVILGSTQWRSMRRQSSPLSV